MTHLAAVEHFRGRMVEGFFISDSGWKASARRKSNGAAIGYEGERVTLVGTKTKGRLRRYPLIEAIRVDVQPGLLDQEAG